MTGAEEKLSAGLPTPWVRWADVPGYLARRFRIDTSLMEDIRWDLHSELMKRNPWIQHRILGVKADEGSPGVLKDEVWSVTDTRTVVMDWSQVPFDPATGTITAVDIRTGDPAPIPVEVYWPSVEEWFERIGQRKVRWRVRQAIGQHLPPSSDHHPQQANKVGSATADAKAVFTVEALGAWFQIRVHTWNKDQPPPTAPEDRAAALSYFEEVPRDAFMKVRRQKVPKSWQKRGPRSR